MDFPQILMQLSDKYMKDNKKNICSIIFLLFVINANAQCHILRQPQDPIYFQISNNVESDSGYNKLLSRYVVSAMTNESIVTLHKDSLMSLYARSSFRNTILYLCDSANYVKINFLYENVDRWVENLPNLLSYCYNKNIQYEISDSLLNKGSEIGLLAMWDSCNIDRLDNYRKYRDSLIVKKNVYLLGDLAVISYNSKNENEYNFLNDFIRKTDENFYLFLRKLLANRRKITYYEYLTDFYDYMGN